MILPKLTLAVAWLTNFALAQTPAKQAPFTRQSLEGAITTYLSALTAHDPSSLPTTSDVKYTENTIPLPLGSGLWKLAGGANASTYRHDFADTQTGQAATITTLTENGIPVIYIARLKLTPAGQISEIETHITRDNAGAERYLSLKSPEALWLSSSPSYNSTQRLSRDQLASQVNAYFTGLQRSTHNPSASFSSDCSRLENGATTTNQQNLTSYGHFHDTVFGQLSCEGQFKSNLIRSLTNRVRDRRYVVDEDRQAVFAFALLEFDGTVRTASLPTTTSGGTDSRPVPEYFDVPRTLAVAEAFKLTSGKIQRVEEVRMEVPYGSRAPFNPDLETLPPSVGNEGLPPLANGPCDSACLAGAVELVLNAMVDHSAAKWLPMAAGTKYSENGRWLEIGDGLWGTLSSYSKPGADRAYAVSFSDTETQNGGYWGEVAENSILGGLSLRVKVSPEGKIVEIEATILRSESPGPVGGNTMTLFRPQMAVEYEGAPLGPISPLFNQGPPPNSTVGGLKEAVGLYFDGLAKHSAAKVPFAQSEPGNPRCTRQDNGLQETNRNCGAQMDGTEVFHPPNGLWNSTMDVHDVRVGIVDTAKGVVTAVAMVDNAGTREMAMLDDWKVPGSYLVSTLFKFDGRSEIVRVESFVKWVPLGYKEVLWS
ncbi:hypothetical protein B0H66DRAFT_567828 [Apodospora peruviana]|uniref:DUF8021 domain-containing protein n=1 Tax=Apodospora peruviana TaxID=516989 RepID=A0AAE0HWD8_9PEZI|nr:hypothetical protein B0H66DRAFT_567828 [Apodospora peruviana]